MLAIAAGLSSMVVGEAQIVGQVRRAAETAAAEGTLSPELVRVVERASATARRVAHETELSGQGRSVVAVGVDQAAGHLPPLEDCRALIVGTGSYAGATVADLRARGLSDIAVYSASNRAEAFAAGHGLRAVPTGALSEAMSRADLVVTCRGTGGPILTADVVAPIAAERATRRLAPQSVATGSYPILFDATVANSLIGHIVGGLTGGALYRQSSFLQDSLGTQILPSFISLREEPHIPRALGSTYFDSEGVATQPRFVIENGIVRGYFLDSYSARKLGMESTGNAGGTHNLYLSSSVSTQAELLRQMGTGLLVTELMGQGVNLLTGDYSRGAAGFWVEGGEIAYPVSGITIAGRLQDMFLNIEGTANDARRNASSKIGSILIGRMTVAGA